MIRLNINNSQRDTRWILSIRYIGEIFCYSFSPVAHTYPCTNSTLGWIIKESTFCIKVNVRARHTHSFRTKHDRNVTLLAPFKQSVCISRQYDRQPKSNRSAGVKRKIIHENDKRTQIFWLFVFFDESSRIQLSSGYKYFNC